MATILEAAKHCDLSDRRFQELLDAGVFERAPRGSYDLDQVRVAYIRHLREGAAGRSAETNELAVEKTRHAKEQADGLAMKNAQMRGVLLDRGEIHLAITDAFVRVRTKMLALPSKLAPLLVVEDSPVKIKELLSDGVNEALTELANTKVAGIPADSDQPEHA